jgi:hypothetical protein
MRFDKYYSGLIRSGRPAPTRSEALRDYDAHLRERRISTLGRPF